MKIQVTVYNLEVEDEAAKTKFMEAFVEWLDTSKYTHVNVGVVPEGRASCGHPVYNAEKDSCAEMSCKRYAMKVEARG